MNETNTKLSFKRQTSKNKLGLLSNENHVIFNKLNVDQENIIDINMNNKIRDTSSQIRSIYQNFKVYDGYSIRQPERLNKMEPNRIDLLKVAVQNCLYKTNFFVKDLNTITRNRNREKNLSQHSLNPGFSNSSPNIKLYKLKESKTSLSSNVTPIIKKIKTKDQKTFNYLLNKNKNENEEKYNFFKTFQSNLNISKKPVTESKTKYKFNKKSLITETKNRINSSYQNLKFKNNSVSKNLFKIINQQEALKDNAKSSVINSDKEILGSPSLDKIPAKIRENFFLMSDKISKLTSESAAFLANQLMSECKVNGAEMGIEDYIFEMKYGVNKKIDSKVITKQDFKIKKINFNMQKIKQRINEKIK